MTIAQRNAYICKAYRTRTRSLRSLADELSLSHSHVRTILISHKVRLNRRGDRRLTRAA